MVKEVIAIKEVNLEKEIVDIFEQFGGVGHTMTIDKLRSELGKRKVKHFEEQFGTAVNNMINKGDIVVKRVDPVSLAVTHIALVRY